MTLTDVRADEPLVAVSHVSTRFARPGDVPLSVLEDVSVELHRGEIVALLGRSGSGKSTLLRTIAGLIAPTEGSVTVNGRPLRGANPSVGMVFQSFALMPWLTIQGNVELGLEARGVPRAERRSRALRAIDMIGLDGFASAYPRELSGGMRQRVGFARALVIEPDALLLDEPFSALDVLTAENLRTEFMELWTDPALPTRAICIVTHNLEEAVLLADRVVVLGAEPGRITGEIRVDLPRPRDRRSPSFGTMVDQLYRLLTGGGAAVPRPRADVPLTRPLPLATVAGLAGLVEIVYSHGGRIDLPDLAAEILFEVDDLFPLVDAAALLGMLDLRGVAALLTPVGAEWYMAGIQQRKAGFAALAVARVPLIRTICRTLENSEEGTLLDDFVLDLLRRGMSDEAARRQLDIAIEWGRYAELFDYDPDRGELVIGS